MRDLGILSDMAEAEIDALVKDGIQPTPAEIVKINALTHEACDHESRMLLSRGVPVMLAGVTLWPLTLHGAEWYSRVGCRLQAAGEEPNETAGKALAYCMTFGRSMGDELDVTGQAAVDRVVAWADGLRCTAAELNTATAQLLDQSAEVDAGLTPREDGAMGPGELSAYLAAVGGGQVQMWERQVSIGYVSAFLSAVIRHNSAMLGGKGGPSLADPKIRATRALGLYVEHIRANRREAAASEGTEAANGR